MRRASVRRVLASRFQGNFDGEDESGFLLHRWGRVVHSLGFWRLCDSPIGAVFLTERWALRHGGGIAGNSGVWWLLRLGALERRIIGPVDTVSDLRATLAKWRRWEESVNETHVPLPTRGDNENG